MERPADGADLRAELRSLADDDTHQPDAVAVRRRRHLLSSGAFLLMIVPLIVCLALQRYFVQGLLAGSVK
jgi:ABC-type glycerol-3-phosphate transport system permease component